MKALILIWLLAHGVPGHDAEVMAPCIAASSAPYVMLGVVWKESDCQNGSRSKAGACSYFGLLGGRYGNPSCHALENDPALACRTADQELGYWRGTAGRPTSTPITADGLSAGPASTRGKRSARQKGAGDMGTE